MPRPYTRRTLGASTGFVGRPLGVHCRANCLVFRGLRSGPPSKAGPGNPQQSVCFTFYSTATRTMSYKAVYFGAATLQQEQYFSIFSFVTTVNGSSGVCEFLRVCVCAIQIISNLVGSTFLQQSGATLLFLCVCCLLLLCIRIERSSMGLVPAMIQQQPHFKVSPWWQPRRAG